MSQEDLTTTVLDVLFMIKATKDTIVEVEGISAPLCEDFCMLLELLKNEIRKKVSA